MEALDFSGLDVCDVNSFLRHIRLHKYEELMQQADITLDQLLAIDDAGLDALGITAQGARTRLLKAIERYNDYQASKWSGRSSLPSFPEEHDLVPQQYRPHHKRMPSNAHSHTRQHSMRSASLTATRHHSIPMPVPPGSKQHRRPMYRNRFDSTLWGMPAAAGEDDVPDDDVSAGAELLDTLTLDDTLSSDHSPAHATPLFDMWGSEAAGVAPAAGPSSASIWSASHDFIRAK